MTIRELSNEAELGEHNGLLLLIDFLVNEKKVVQFNDDMAALDLYLLPKHREKMNGHLSEYIEKRRGEATWICGGMF